MTCAGTLPDRVVTFPAGSAHDIVTVYTRPTPLPERSARSSTWCTSMTCQSISVLRHERAGRQHDLAGRSRCPLNRADHIDEPVAELERVVVAAGRLRGTGEFADCLMAN
jgi:hypothetical protein